MSSYPENIRSSKNGNGQTPEEDMASLPARVPNGYAAGFKK
jgi:hypothetical protein